MERKERKRRLWEGERRGGPQKEERTRAISEWRQIEKEGEREQEASEEKVCWIL